MGTHRLRFALALSCSFLLAAVTSAGTATSLQPGPDRPGKDWHPADRVVPDGTLPPSGPAGFDIAAWEAHRFGPLSNWPPAEDDPAVDVLRYDLDLAFGLEDTTIAGTATITLVWGSNPDDTLRLDLADLTVSAVRDGDGVPLAFTRTGDRLLVVVSPPPVRGDTVTVAVEYGGHPSAGFYVKPDASYTFTEPEDSRYWFPCRDVPWDKATLSLHGRVPAGKKLVGNGVLDSTTVAGGDLVYHWREDHPLATYLMAAAISDYAEVVPPYSVTPLTWYVYPSDTSAAATAFQNVDRMVAFFDSLLAPYPFDKYAMCEADFGGGMEHQSCTLMADFIVTAGLGYEWITAHELAHQWFGDLVTLADWRHIWLNEGFATFYEAVWQEDFYGPERFDQRMQTFQDHVFTWEDNYGDHPILDPPPSNLFGWLEYYKGAWVLRMLRDLMGREAYNAGVRDYLAAHAYGNADTDDFRQAMEARYGQPLDWYFDQWLLGTGHPELTYVPMFSSWEDGWLVQISVTQTQESPTVFRFPLEVRIATVAGDTLVTGWVESDYEVLHFQVPDEPLSVELDPANKLLDEHTEGATTAAAGIPPAQAFAWPNPFRSRLWIRSAPGAGPERRIEIFDVSGRRVRVLSGAGPQVWNGTDEGGRRLPPGTYFVRGREPGEAARVVLLP